VVLQKDGCVSAFSEKLGEPLWTTPLSDAPSATDGFDLPEDFEIRHAELVSREVASHGILSGRQDVLAGMEDSEFSSTVILVVLGTSPSVGSPDVLDLDLHMYAIRSSSSRLHSLAKPQQLLSWNVPHAVKRTSSQVMDHQLDSKAGRLIELIDGKVISYDLTGLSPRIVDTFTSRNALLSVIKLSASILLSASAEKLSVYDSKFGSLLATQAIPPPSATSKKSKTKSDDLPMPPLRFIGYLRQSGNVIALRGSELLVIQIGEEARSNKRKTSGTLLIDSLARGTLGSRLRSEAHGAEGSCHKKKRTKVGTSALFTSPELDALLEQGEIEEWEKQLAATVGLISSPNSSKTSNEADGGDEAKERVLPSPSSEWKFPKLSKLHGLPVHRPQALYALSKFFAPTSSQANGDSGLLSLRRPSIQLELYTENVFLWLVHTGQLRADLIQSALSQYHGINEHIPHGEIVQALASFDDDLSLVHYLLMYHPNLPIEEVVMAVKTIVNSLDKSTLPQPEHKLLMDNEFATAAATTGALTGGVGIGNGPGSADALKLNGQVDEKEQAENPEKDIESVTDAAMRDVDELMDQAYEQLDNVLPIRGETLRQSLTRLNNLPREQVVGTLRAMLTQHELIFLVHILRVELDSGGWTTRYADRGEDDGTEDPSNNAIVVITNVLSHAADAVGMSGWLATSASNPIDDIDETLRLLRGEISNTLEGIHEAAFVAGVLGDFLQYAHRAHSTSNELSDRRKSSTLEKDEEMWKRGKTVVVEEAPPSRLPMGLGLENEQGIRTAVAELETKSMSGLVRRKEARDIGRELRRGLPPYVFERIRF
jgi:hypothetical protein